MWPSMILLIGQMCGMMGRQSMSCCFYVLFGLEGHWGTASGTDGGKDGGEVGWGGGLSWW